MQTLLATQTSGQINIFVIFRVLTFWKTHSCSSMKYFPNFELTHPSEMQEVIIIYDELCIQ